MNAVSAMFASAFECLAYTTQVEAETVREIDRAADHYAGLFRFVADVADRELGRWESRQSSSGPFDGGQSQSSDGSSRHKG